MLEYVSEKHVSEMEGWNKKEVDWTATSYCMYISGHFMYTLMYFIHLHLACLGTLSYEVLIQHTTPETFTDKNLGELITEMGHCHWLE